MFSIQETKSEEAAANISYVVKIVCFVWTLILYLSELGDRSMNRTEAECHVSAMDRQIR